MYLNFSFYYLCLHKYIVSYILYFIYMLIYLVVYTTNLLFLVNKFIVKYEKIKNN